MARSFALLALLFVGGSLAASAAAGTIWPTVCAAVALRYLLKVYSACDDPPEPPKPAYHRGRKDWRMPT